LQRELSFKIPPKLPRDTLVIHTLKEAERAMIKMTMAAKIPIFLFMEIVIHSFLREGRMITSCCNSYVSFFMSFVAF